MKFSSSARDRVARHLLEHGPASVSDVASALSLTQTAVRRQLDLLVALGMADSHERAPFGPMAQQERGRGRPAKFFALTAAGREHFEGAYDSIALDALRMLKRKAGSDSVRELVRERLSRGLDQKSGLNLEELAAELADRGYAAEVRPAPLGEGNQLCLRNCPISHVAAEFPEFCEVETELIADRLGVHVVRLSTISGGADLCTVHVPPRRNA